MKNFYANANRYGTETSQGFENTRFVLVFQTKKERDSFCSNSNKMSNFPITKKEALAIAEKNYRGQKIGFDINKNEIII